METQEVPSTVEQTFRLRASTLIGWIDGQAQVRSMVKDLTDEAFGHLGRGLTLTQQSGSLLAVVGGLMEDLEVIRKAASSCDDQYISDLAFNAIMALSDTAVALRRVWAQRLNE